MTFVLVSTPVLTASTYGVAWPQGDQFLGGDLWHTAMAPSPMAFASVLYPGRCLASQPIHLGSEMGEGQRCKRGRLKPPPQASPGPGHGPPAQWLSLPFHTPEGAWPLSPLAPAAVSRWFSTTGPCQVGVNRATSASFACIGASVLSS